MSRKIKTIITERYREQPEVTLEGLFPEGVWEHDKVDDNGAAHLKAAVLVE